MFNYLVADLMSTCRPDRVEILQRFFQTHKGGYGEGDLFLGHKVPELRKIAKKYYKIIDLNQLQNLISSQYHEHRLTALIILVLKMSCKKTTDDEKKEIYDFYLKNMSYINNRDLVDVTAPIVIGQYLWDKNDFKILKILAKSKSVWDRRISMVSTFWFIRREKYELAIDIAKMLLKDENNLIHKAVGWMLREIGNRNKSVELEFLDEFVEKMPRIMLRYAIEKFPESERKGYLKCSRKVERS